MNFLASPNRRLIHELGLVCKKTCAPLSTGFALNRRKPPMITSISHLSQDAKLFFKKSDSALPGILGFGIRNCSSDATEASSSKMKYIALLHGLPYYCRKHEVVAFLEGVNIVGGEDGVIFSPHGPVESGKNYGDAFVILESEEDLKKALKKSLGYLSNRYVEVSVGSELEMKKTKILYEELEAAHIVRLRGYPHMTSKAEIMKFLNGIDIVGGNRGVAFYGNWCGVAVRTEEDVERALALHKTHLGSRYIEVSVFRPLKKPETQGSEE